MGRLILTIRFLKDEVSIMFIRFLKFAFILIIAGFIGIGCSSSSSDDGDSTPSGTNTPTGTIDNSDFYGTYKVTLAVGDCDSEVFPIIIGNDESQSDTEGYIYVPQAESSYTSSDGTVTVSGNTISIYLVEDDGEITDIDLVFNDDYSSCTIRGTIIDDECSGTATGSATRSVNTNGWDELTENPVLAGLGGEGYDDCMVLKDDESYKMWFQAESNQSIFYATSDDGIVWTEHPSPVLEPGPAGSWDEIEADGPMVIKESGLYKMWYSSEGPSQIGYATSPDGINWTKNVGNPLLEGGSPTVVKDGATYRMWYNKDESGSDNDSILYAVSDDGIEWTIQNGGNPVLAYGGSSFVIKENSTYEIWYECSDESGICYATSIDGITWNIFPDNPVVAWAGDPTVIIDEYQYKMWCITSEEDGVYYTSTLLY